MYIIDSRECLIVERQSSFHVCRIFGRVGIFLGGYMKYRYLCVCVVCNGRREQNAKQQCVKCAPAPHRARQMFVYDTFKQNFIITDTGVWRRRSIVYKCSSEAGMSQKHLL